MDTLTAIIQHGLSVRQIPLQTVHRYAMRHHKPGHEIVRYELPNITPELFAWHKKHHSDSPDFELNEERQTVTRVSTQEIKVPQYAGWWLCQKVSHTSSRVEWNYKTDHLAPTLQESVALCVAGL